VAKKTILDTDEELKSILDYMLNKIEYLEQEFTKRQPLTDEQRLEIIHSKEPVNKLAVKYNRSRQQIWNIRKGK